MQTSMTPTKATIDRLAKPISASVTGRLPIAVAIRRNPEETEAEAIERCRREHPEIAAMPEAALTIHVLSWQD
jgi:hypothetical protein